MIKNVFIVIVFQFLLMMTLKSSAQDILWLHYFNRYKLSYKFSIDSDIGYREYISEGNRGQLRSGLRYDINDKMYVRGGVMFVGGTQVRRETRWYQDFVLNTKVNAFTLTQRARFEQQLFEGSDKAKVRLRYNASVKYSSPYGFLTLGVEPFIPLNDSHLYIGSYRTYVGVTRRAYKNTFVTLEYINERIRKRNEHTSIIPTHLIRIKVSHVINPLKVGPLFGRNK